MPANSGSSHSGVPSAVVGHHRAGGEVGADADDVGRVDAGRGDRRGHGGAQHVDVVAAGTCSAQSGGERGRAVGQDPVEHRVRVVVRRAEPSSAPSLTRTTTARPDRVPKSTPTTYPSPFRPRRSGHVRSGHVRSGQVRSGHVASHCRPPGAWQGLGDASTRGSPSVSVHNAAVNRGPVTIPQRGSRRDSRPERPSVAPLRSARRTAGHPWTDPAMDALTFPHRSSATGAVPPENGPTPTAGRGAPSRG